MVRGKVSIRFRGRGRVRGRGIVLRWGYVGEAVERLGSCRQIVGEMYEGCLRFPILYEGSLRFR